VRHLPHQLVDAFRSTLEEAKDADLVLHVVDGSDADPQAQLEAVRAVLAEIGADKVPELVVINKIDDADPVMLKAVQLKERNAVLVSAKTGEGLDALKAVIEESLPERDILVRVTVPYSRGDLVSRVHAAGEVSKTEHGPDGTFLEARVPPELAADLRQYAVM
jgi:GTP-binding protein HflX